MNKREREKKAYTVLKELTKQGIKPEDISKALERLQKNEKRKEKELQMREYIYSVALSHYRRTGKRIDTNRVIYFLEKFWKFTPTTMKRKKETIKIINEEINRAKNRYFYEKRKRERIKKEIIGLIKEQAEEKNLSPAASKMLCSRLFGEDCEFKENGVKESNSLVLIIILDKIAKLNSLMNSYAREIKTSIADKEKVTDDELFLILSGGKQQLL